MNKLLLLIAASFSFASASWAQNSALPEKQSTTELKPIIGMIQYADGEITWGESGKDREAPEFQSLIHYGDSLAISDGAKIKIVTDQLCQGVVYGPGNLVAPTEDSPWAPKGSGMRWICPAGKKEILSIDGKEVWLEGGELLHKDGKLIARKATAKVDGVTLEVDSTYEKESETWKKADSQLSEYKRWKLHNSLVAPKESLAFARPLLWPDRRWIISFGYGGSSINHAEDSFDTDNSDAAGIYVQYQKKWRHRNLTFGLGFNDMSTGGSGNEDNQGPRDASGAIQAMYADVGLKWKHENTWAPYARAGIGFGSFQGEGNLVDDNGNFAQDVSIESNMIMAVLTLGVEKTFLNEKISSWGLGGWHGLYTNLELRVFKSITSSESRSEEFINGGPSIVLDDDILAGSVFSASIVLSVGFPFAL